MCKMQCSLVFSAVLVGLLCAVLGGEITHLTDKNFEEFVHEHKFVLVEFYAPWCAHCKRFEPEYKKVAAEVDELDASVMVTAIDATSEKNAVAKYDVRGFPTIKFFAEAKVAEYEGQRDAASIIAWLRKKTGDPAKKLFGIEEVENFRTTALVTVVGFFQDESLEREQFFMAARENDNIPFGAVVDNHLTAEHFGAPFPGIVIFTSETAGFDQQKAYYTGEVFDKVAISKFVQVESLPLVIEFSSKTSRQIFTGSVQKHLFFFGSFETEQIELVKKVARHARGEFVVSTIAATEQRALDFFGLDQANLPALQATRFDGMMRKYAYGGSLDDLASMNAFADGILDGTVRPELKTESIPTTATDAGAVATVVGANFNQVVLDTSKEVFVQIYAPWCGHSKRLAPVWEQLAQKFSMYPTLLFAKMDATANEHELVEVQGFPTIQFYNMHNTMVQFSGTRDLDSLISFVTEQTGVSPIDMHEEL